MGLTLMPARSVCVCVCVCVCVISILHVLRKVEVSSQMAWVTRVIPPGAIIRFWMDHKSSSLPLIDMNIILYYFLSLTFKMS